jgi:hypothetical protein
MSSEGEKGIEHEQDFLNPLIFVLYEYSVIILACYNKKKPGKYIYVSLRNLI